MSLIDEIKRDREAGTTNLPVYRVYDMQAALLAAEELTQAVMAQTNGERKAMSPRVAAALAAYRKATGGEG